MRPEATSTSTDLTDRTGLIDLTEQTEQTDARTGSSTLRAALLLLVCASLLVACRGESEPDESSPAAESAEKAEKSEDDETSSTDEDSEKQTEPAPEPVEPLGEVSTDSLKKLQEVTGAAARSGGGQDDAPPELDADTLTELSSVTTDPGDIPQLKIQHDGELYDLPLQNTHVQAHVSGHVTRVEVTQTYQNPFSEPIETVYVFPLPENSAVDAMRMVIGERVVEAEIQKRAEARKTYEKAKAAGHTAALLEQERPNIFTQSVANIAPESTIDVTIGYVQDLSYDAGQFEFVFPMVVGPRYVPQRAEASEDGALQLVPDTDRVPDAARIIAPVVGHGMRSGNNISIELTADVGLPVDDVRSPTHELALTQQQEGGFELTLADDDTIPNRDFVVRWKTAGQQPAATLLTHRPEDADEDGKGYFMLVVQPPALDVEEKVGKREFIFVVDISGSMRGKPLELCKDAMRHTLRQLRPVDTFNIISFESRDAQVFESSRPASDANIQAALEFVGAMRAGGGTELGNAVEAALGAEPEPGRHRNVFFMTDARIGNESEILSMTRSLKSRYEDAGQRARVFTFGTGRSPNHYLLETLADVGDGLAVYATLREDPAHAVNRFFSVVDHPIIENVHIDWGGLDVDGVHPSPRVMPDLFLTHPLVVHGRYEEPGTGTIKILGRTDGEPIELAVDATLPKAGSDGEAIGTLWARASIDELERELWDGRNEQAIEAITQLGLEHDIVTKYTSFVAVDRSKTVGDGDPKTIVQPGDHDTEGEEKALDPGMPVPNSPAPSGSASGNYGLGMKGSGTGGGGSSAGSFQIGSVGTRGYGSGSGKLHSKSSTKPMLKPARPDVSGGLDKRIVERVVRMKRRTVMSCHKKAGSPNGRLVVKFVIDASGNVSNATVVSNSTGSKKLGACTASLIKKKWRFPAPKGGGLVVVKYPFVFTTGASSPSLGTGVVGAADVNRPDLLSPAIDVNGARDADAFREVLNAHRHDLQGCDVRAKDVDGEVLELELTIDAAGFVVDPSVKKDETGSKGLAECVAGRMSTWRFEPADGPSTVALSYGGSAE